MQTICRLSSYSFPAFYGGFALRRPMNCYQNSFVATRKLWAPPPASRGGVYTCAARGLLHTEGKNLHSRIFPRVILIPEISDDEGEAALTLDVTYEVVTEIFSCHLRHGIFARENFRTSGSGFRGHLKRIGLSKSSLSSSLFCSRCSGTEDKLRKPLKKLNRSL